VLSNDIGWDRVRSHDSALAHRLRDGLAAIPGVSVLGPGPDTDVLPIATFVVDGVPHALVAARLSAEFAIGVRHGCFCAHPYLMRLLGVGEPELDRLRGQARRHDRHAFPGAVRASGGVSTNLEDVDRLLAAVGTVATTAPPVDYAQDPVTGDFWPSGPDRHRTELRGTLRFGELRRRSAGPRRWRRPRRAGQ
jgi:selenocysteine lyase/cysteine desulfurase